MGRRQLRFLVRSSVHHARLGPKGKVRVRSAELRSEGGSLLTSSLPKRVRLLKRFRVLKSILSVFTPF